ncbi:MAG TPA: hypothetical protein VFX03_07680, partial [Thermomicrobiales bacterium]|nr:hypothetical protein [Thermomicrobiales bacterium]
MTAPNLQLISTTPGGLLEAGTYNYVVTAINATGETTSSNELLQLISPGGNQTINLSWAAVPGASGYKIYRGGASGGEN